MKFNSFVSSASSKSRKRHSVASPTRHPLIATLQGTSCQIRRPFRAHQGDEVLVARGHYRGNAGRVAHVYRKKFVIHLEKLTREKANGSTVPIGLHPSKVVVTKLKLDKDRKAMLQRKAEGRARVLGRLQKKIQTDELGNE